MEATFIVLLIITLFSINHPSNSASLDAAKQKDRIQDQASSDYGDLQRSNSMVCPRASYPVIERHLTESMNYPVEVGDDD